MKKCLLLSGGIDSFCLAFLQRPDIAITIDYGQSALKRKLDLLNLYVRSLESSMKLSRLIVAT